MHCSRKKAPYESNAVLEIRITYTIKCIFTHPKVEIISFFQKNTLRKSDLLISITKYVQTEAYKNSLVYFPNLDSE
jgi:hypothetical protein